MKLKTCKHCKAEFKPSRPLQSVCSLKCARLKARNDLAKKQAKVNKASLRERKKELKSNDRQHQLKLTQGVFNKLRKLQEFKWFSDRGLQPTCISCGREKGNDQWACGHFKTVAGNSALRFDERNTFLQHNHRCNKHLSGDIEGTSSTHGYKQGLINRFGEKEGNSIIDYCETYQPSKDYSCEELISMRKAFNQSIREIERGYDKWIN